MQWFKSIGLLLLCAMLACSGCSKDKEDKAKSSRATASKTVDLGETDAADADDAKSQRPARKNSRAKVVGEEDPNDEVVARKNDAAAVNEDGSAKRGKPAAELEAEDAAKNAAKDAAKQDAAPESAENAAPDAVEPADAAPAFDFAAEEKPARPPRKPAPAPRIVQKRQGLNIENLININEFREITGYAGLLEQTDLDGQTSDSHYNVIRLSTDKASELGFALQVWKLGNESAASKRFDEMFKQSFGGVKQKDIASDAFLAAHHTLNELAFYDKTKRSVVLISCTDSICKKDHLKSIATTIQRRL